MLLHIGIERMHAEWPAAVACVGTFDGVHLGHRAVISAAVRRAREKRVPAVLVTFDRHPAAVLAPDRCPQAIASVEDNLSSFAELGVAAAVVLPFDKALSEMSAQTFLDSILLGSVRASSVVVGHDFAMGHGRQGTAEWLNARLPTEVLSPFEIDGLRVSSSAIRHAVSSGDLSLANRLLGRSFAISGVVVGGQQLGRTLGYPTANIGRAFDQVLPKDGIYAASASTPFGVFKAALSIGMRPAVGGTSRTIEAFLLDYPGEELYGQSVRLELVKRLRDEKNFESLEALVEQIRLDVEAVRVLSVLS